MRSIDKKNFFSKIPHFQAWEHFEKVREYANFRRKKASPTTNSQAFPFFFQSKKVRKTWFPPLFSSNSTLDTDLIYSFFSISLKFSFGLWELFLTKSLFFVILMFISSTYNAPNLTLRLKFPTENHVFCSFVKSRWESDTSCALLWETEGKFENVQLFFRFLHFSVITRQVWCILKT